MEERKTMRVTPDNPVRRVLFPPSEGDDVRNENFNNRLKEEFEKELEEKSTAWNFDFKKECPMPGKSPVEWVKDQYNPWIGVVNRIDNTAEVNPPNEINNPNGIDNSNDINEQVEISCIVHEKFENETNRTPQKKEPDANGEKTPVKD